MYGTTALIAKVQDNMKRHHEGRLKQPASKTATPFDPYYPVVCAALRLGNRIICGVRHYDPIMREQIHARKNGSVEWRAAEQGFVNACGQFLNREDAHHVATAHGQIRRRVGGDAHQLFSENLY